MRWIAFLLLSAVLLLAAACAETDAEPPLPPTATVERPTDTPLPPTDTRSPPTDTPAPCPEATPWNQAIRHVGERATVRGPVAGTLYASGSNGQPTFLNVGRDYPDPDRFTVVIWGENRVNFPFAPEVEYDNRTICVTGFIETYEGVPQIEADTPSDIEIVD